MKKILLLLCFFSVVGFAANNPKWINITLNKVSVAIGGSQTVIQTAQFQENSDGHVVDFEFFDFEKTIKGSGTCVGNIATWEYTLSNEKSGWWYIAASVEGENSNVYYPDNARVAVVDIGPVEWVPYFNFDARFGAAIIAGDPHDFRMADGANMSANPKPAPPETRYGAPFMVRITPEDAQLPDGFIKLHVQDVPQGAPAESYIESGDGLLKDYNYLYIYFEQDGDFKLQATCGSTTQTATIHVGGEGIEFITFGYQEDIMHNVLEESEPDQIHGWLSFDVPDGMIHRKVYQDGQGNAINGQWWDSFATAAPPAGLGAPHRFLPVEPHEQPLVPFVQWTDNKVINIETGQNHIASHYYTLMRFHTILLDEYVDLEPIIPSNGWTWFESVEAGDQILTTPSVTVTESVESTDPNNDIDMGALNLFLDVVDFEASKNIDVGQGTSYSESIDTNPPNVWWGVFKGAIKYKRLYDILEIKPFTGEIIDANIALLHIKELPTVSKSFTHADNPAEAATIEP